MILRTDWPSSPNVYLGFPAQDMAPSGLRGAVSLGRPFQAQEHVKTKVLSSFT
jgi:hypothetical protein